MMTMGNLAQNAPMYGLVFTNNLVTISQYPVWDAVGSSDSCAHADVPVTSIANCFTTYTFSNNALVDVPKAFPASKWPDGNFFPGTVNEVGLRELQQRQWQKLRASAEQPLQEQGHRRQGSRRRHCWAQRSAG